MTTDIDVFVCPLCRRVLTAANSVLHCPQCGDDYPVIRGIPDFRPHDAYWCNVSREKMQSLNRLARASGDWQASAKRVIPSYLPHLKPFHRADAQFLWPTGPESVILDAGAMWGGLSLPAAQYHRRVYAVDKTLETLEFLSIRAEQEGLSSIRAVAAPLHRLPFPDGFFDLVILNGVLEWTALDADIVLERQWRKNWTGLHAGRRGRYAVSAREAQLAVLRELRRVLKPGGALYLAIENRIGYIYLAGWPDDHMNLPFVCFLPRFAADAITRLALKTEYRTNVYSIDGTRALLKEAGYGEAAVYGAFPHYISPTHLVPRRRIAALKGDMVTHGRRFTRQLLKLIPAPFLTLLAPSMALIAPAGARRSPPPPRIARLLARADLAPGGPERLEVAKCPGRDGDMHTVNFLVWTDRGQDPSYFCKICRHRNKTSILQDEAANLKTVEGWLAGTPLIRDVPRLSYFGTLEGVTLLVTGYRRAKRLPFTFNSRLNRRGLSALVDGIHRAMAFLASFQAASTRKWVNARPAMLSRVAAAEAVLDSRGDIPTGGRRACQLARLREDISALPECRIPVCGVHGDFDFFSNIMFHEGRAVVFDFEHLKGGGLPFYDIATLVFHPILLSYERCIRRRPVARLLARSDIGRLVADAHRQYAALSGVAPQVLRLAPAMAVLAQLTRVYPSYRDVSSFPLSAADALDALLEFRTPLATDTRNRTRQP